MRKGMAAAVLVAAVAVGGGVGVGAAYLAGGEGGGERTAQASPTPAEPTSLDDIVAGTGARATSATVPGLGVGYPDTCIGAAQAAAGWQVQAMMPGPAMQSAIDAKGDMALGLEAFYTALTDEVLIPGILDSGQDGVKQVFGAMPAIMAATADEGETWRERDMGATVVTPLAFRMESCTEHSMATVTLVSQAKMSEKARAAVPEEMLSGDGAPVFSTMEFSSHGGVWRLSAVETSAMGTRDPQSGERQGYIANFDLSRLNVSAMEDPMVQLLQTQNATPEIRHQFAQAFGRGGHVYLEGTQ